MDEMFVQKTAASHRDMQAKMGWLPNQETQRQEETERRERGYLNMIDNQQADPLGQFGVLRWRADGAQVMYWNIQEKIYWKN